MELYRNLTDEQKQRVIQFIDNLLQGEKIRKQLARKTDVEIAESLMRLSDDMVIESPQAILLEVVAERLGYVWDEDVEGYHFERAICPECGRSVAFNWFIRHLNSGCKIGGKEDVENDA